MSRGSTERNVSIGIGLFMVAVVAVIWFMSGKGTSREPSSTTALMGDEIPIQGDEHVAPGQSHADYVSNPPTSGPMYDGVGGAGIHDEEVADELLVHSLEHGAVVVHHRADLPKDQLKQVKDAYNSASGKKILVPRKNLDVPVALTSWGRLLKLQSVDSATIKAFIETNENNGPERSSVY